MTERDRLAQRHMGLVRALCSRFCGKGVEYDELFAAGCLGLSKALNSFDPTRGTQFSTYAFPVIAGEIKRLFRDGGAVRVSRSLKELAQKVAKLTDEAERRGEAPTVSVLARQLGVSPEKLAEAVAAVQPPLSLTACTESGEPQLDVPVPDMQELVTDRLTLRAAIDALDERDKALIRLRYYQGKTQTRTAQALQMTQVQVSRREKKILAEIRKSFLGA